MQPEYIFDGEDALGSPCQHCVLIEQGKRKLERKVDPLIWLTWGLSDCSEDRVMNSLGLVYHWFCRAIEGSVNIRACKIRAFQPGKEEELSSSSFQFGK